MLFNWAFLSLICAIRVLGLKNSLLENNFNWFQEEKISDFKLKLRKIFEELSSLKTAMELEHNMVPYISTSRVQTGIAKGISEGCTVQVDGTEIVFVVASRSLSELRNTTITPILKFPSSRIFLSLQALVDGRNVILVTQISDRRYGHLVNLYDYDFKNLKHRHKIRLDGRSLVSATKIDTQFYVVAVPRSSPFPTLTVYQRTGLEYKITADHRMNASCSGLETWNFGASLHVALSCVNDGTVEVLQFLEESRQFSSIQVINVYAFVLKVVKEQDNTYLICGTRKSVILYWWAGYRFREMHSKLFQKKIMDVTAHTFLDRIVIAVAFRDEVEFLTQDSSARYVIAGNQTFDTADSLKSVLLWKDRRSLFMMPLFKGKRPVSVFEIHLRFDVADPQKEHALKQCIDKVELQMNEREKFIEDRNSELKNLWRPSETRRISSLIVNGSIKSNSSSIIRTLHLSRYLLSLKSLRHINVKLRDSVNHMSDLISGSVTKSAVNQMIHGDVRFSKLFVRNVTVEQLLNHTIINKVPSKRLSYALKKKGQQIFPYKMSVFAANATRVTTTLLNKNVIGEYVLLKKGSWNMTGHFTFGNVSAENIKTHTINGVNVPEIVLRSKTQEIRGDKSFKKLYAKSVQTVEQRKMHLDGIKGLVYLDSKQFRSPVKFDSLLRIKGNLTVSVLNRKNLTHHFLSSVRRRDDADIFGSKVFHSIVVNDKTTVFGGINGFSPKNLMTVNTEQRINGNVTFSSDAIFRKNIKTVSLNGHDLMSEAVKISDSECEIKGLKIFQEDLKVSNITMDDGIQIDYFDPSEEVSKLIFRIPDNNATFSHETTVANIVARNVRVKRRHFPILKELGNVWLKTNEQNITFFKTGKMTVSELKVSSVNGIEMQNFIPVSEDCSIDETITFSENISTKTLNLQKEAKVDFPPEFWNPNVMVKIYGNITIENPAVEGNVTVSGMFENFEKDFMDKALMQDVIGPVKFGNVTLNELNGAYLYFDTLNGKNFTDYYNHAVLLSRNKNISRKTFNKLRGTAMICYGTLNNVSLDKIASINMPQKLTSSYKLYDTKFKNITLNFLNGMKLEKVVFKDTKRSISNKHFNKSITSLNVTTDENINGLNLTKLNKEAFSKTGNSKTGGKITFRGNVTLDELQVRKNKTVDGINLENLIMINETNKLESFNVSVRNASINAENVIIKGFINGCNVSMILENALLLKENAQNITSKVVLIKTLEVQGNLSVKYANGANVMEWIDVLNTTSASDTDSNVTFEHLIADHVHILDTVNNISLKLLFKDSVRKNYSQVILGMKIFEDIEVTDVNMSSVASNKTCGIDLLDVYKNAINKTEEKEIILRSNLKLANLTMKDMTVDGKLNGLKLPDDVVLSYVNEHIDDELFINSTINATAGLNVSGKIDSIEMETFVQERVTLNATEIIYAELVFENDAYISGNTSIDSLINKIRLYDVVNKLQNYTIDGKKTFKQELNITSNATVNGYINGLLIDSLDKSILKVSRNETSLKGEIKLSRASLSSLMCVTINGINIQNFYNYTHKFVHEIRTKLYDFTSDIQKHEDLMRPQKENTVENPVSLFNSFELHKILNYSYIEKFVPIYEYGSYGPNYDRQVTGMILWIKLNRTRDCRSTRSIISDVSSDGSLQETSRKWGKYFLFSLYTEREGVVGFSVQAEYTNCTEEQKIRITAVSSTNKMKANTIKPPANATLLDIHLLEEDDVFLIFSFSKAVSNSSETPERIFVFRYDASSKNWTSHQILHSQELTSVNFVSVENEEELWNALPSVYLSVTGHEANPGVTVYKWMDDEFYPRTNVSTSASSYSCWVFNDDTLYLLLSKENKGIKSENGTRTPVFSETLEVYTLDEELILNHTVDVEGVTSMDVFMLADETYVLATSNRKGMVYVLQFRGYNGFEVIQEIPSPGVTEARVFTVNGQSYVGINSKTVPSKILKATISGGRQGFELLD